MRILRLWTALLSLLLLCACGAPLPPTLPQFYLEVDGSGVDPTQEALAEGFWGLTESPDSYVYLEPEEAVQGVWYLSVALPQAGYNDGLGYLVEVCVSGPGDGLTYLLGRIREPDKALALLEDYLLRGVAPDTADWENISDWYQGQDPYGGYDTGPQLPQAV